MPLLLECVYAQHMHRDDPEIISGVFYSTYDITIAKCLYEETLDSGLVTTHPQTVSLDICS